MDYIIGLDLWLLEEKDLDLCLTAECIQIPGEFLQFGIDLRFRKLFFSCVMFDDGLIKWFFPSK